MNQFRKVLKLVLMLVKRLNTPEAYEAGKKFGENIMENKDIVLGLVDDIIKESGLSAGSRTIGLEKTMIKDVLDEIERESN